MSNAGTTHAPLAVTSASGRYEVCFVPDAVAVVDALKAYPRRFVVIDERVAARHPALVHALGDTPLMTFAASEDEKTLAGVARIIDFLQAHQAPVTSVLVVIGGGIIQDVATFAASIFRRGIAYVLVPTTLLAMADSCIGAKFGVNHGPAKNQLGGFLSPRAVIIAKAFLDTLSVDELRSGYGEIVKLAIIGGAGVFNALEHALERDGFYGDTLGDVQRSLAVKRRFIEEDEFDVGVRRILNYGHTFGHALEAETGYDIPHGLAIAWGMDLINSIGRRFGVLAPEEDDRMHALFARHFRTTVSRPYGVTGLLARIRQDKKAGDGAINLVVPRAIGDVDLLKVPIDGALADAVAAYMRDRDLFSAA